MVKVMRICCYQTGISTKFGSQDKLDGIAYQNRYSSSHGHEIVSVWIPHGKLELDDSILDKDLYCEFGLGGRVDSALIKEVSRG